MWRLAGQTQSDAKRHGQNTHLELEPRLAALVWQERGMGQLRLDFLAQDCFLSCVILGNRIPSLAFRLPEKGDDR